MTNTIKRKKDETRDDWISRIIESKDKPTYRIAIGVPTTGLVRIEWVRARYGQVIPCNWAHAELMTFLNQTMPLNYSVADARNLCVDSAIKAKSDWLLFIDHDVLLPPHFFVAVNERIIQEDVPCWSGLYFTKSEPAEPLVYRGRGNGYYPNWKIGDKVMVDGLPMGCTVISMRIIRAMADDAESYSIEGKTIKRVFRTPNDVLLDPQTLNWYVSTGTEDLNFCARVIKGRYFDKAGYHKYQEKEYPFLIDTSLYCKHIDMNGIQYPRRGEEAKFMRKRKPDKKKK